MQYGIDADDVDTGVNDMNDNAGDLGGADVDDDHVGNADNYLGGFSCS